jgi:hypothetical protein
MDTGVIFKNITRAHLYLMKLFGHLLLQELRYLAGGTLEKSSYLVVPEKKLVYLVNSKVACSSFKQVLLASVAGKQVSDDYSVHTDPEVVRRSRRYLGGAERKFFVFTFVRNPFERLVSTYVNKFCDYRKIAHAGFEYQYYLGGIFKPADSFAEFVDKVASIPDRAADRHFVSQSFMICRMANHPPDFIGRLESVTEDYRELAERFGLPELPHFNKSSHYDYREYYRSRTLVEKVYRKYRADVDDLGYRDVYEKLLKDASQP